MVEERPTVRFITALQQLLNTGDLILLHRVTGSSLNPMPLQGGTFAGWYDEEGYYLLPEVAWKAVSELLRADSGFGLSKNAVWDLLTKEGLAIKSSNRNTHHIKVNGASKRVLHLVPNVFQKVLDGGDIA